MASSLSLTWLAIEPLELPWLLLSSKVVRVITYIKEWKGLIVNRISTNWPYSSSYSLTVELLFFLTWHLYSSLAPCITYPSIALNRETITLSSDHYLLRTLPTLAYFMDGLLLPTSGCIESLEEEAYWRAGFCLAVFYLSIAITTTMSLLQGPRK